MAELIAVGTAQADSADFTNTSGTDLAIFLKTAASQTLPNDAKALIQVKSSEGAYLYMDRHHRRCRWFNRDARRYPPQLCRVCDHGELDSARPRCPVRMTHTTHPTHIPIISAGARRRGVVGVTQKIGKERPWP